MNQQTRKWIADGCIYSLVFLFVYTATSKLFRLNVFEAQLTRFPWIEHIAPVIAWAVPVAELVAAGLLLTRRTRRTGLFVSLVLMTAFTLFIAFMLGTEKHLPCSCGGVISWMNWKQHLVFNIFFTIVPIMGLVYSSPKIQIYAT
ncbi:MAG: hypothetical protein J0H74_26870 [Chitinophagaceae bacterium]|nr:hypothetical protein [Chitinophagaceae bacterium]